MSVKTETIHVRISPGVRVWQVLLVGAALVASLLLGLFIGRASAPPPDAGHLLNHQEFAPYMCTGHVPNPGCELKVARAYGHTAHIHADGSAAYG